MRLAGKTKARKANRLTSDHCSRRGTPPQPTHTNTTNMTRNTHIVAQMALMMMLCMVVATPLRASDSVSADTSGQ